MTGQRLGEHEPIERVRARLEALVMANAAPRCGARSKRTGKPCRGAAMPISPGGGRRLDGRHDAGFYRVAIRCFRRRIERTLV
jgi:hypothetical protein